MIILVLNAGSSSQKSCLYSFSLDSSLANQSLEPLWEAHLDWTVSQTSGILTVKSQGIKTEIAIDIAEKQIALEQLLDTLITGKTKILDSLNEIDIVGHRVVHGGAKYSQATIINLEVKKAIAALIPLAPNHNPSHLEGIETIERILPHVTQVAVFDTAFHATIPEFAKVYPIPYQYYQQGIQRYGFHGTSHQYCAQRTAEILQQPLQDLKIVTCHLGNGCSLAAIKNGICIDTTMGFSPLEGLMMGTRCGSIDPLIPLHLMTEYNLDAAAINYLLTKESGLKGVSGISADLRMVIQEISNNNQRAKLAFDIYLHRLKTSIGAMVGSLNGLDVLIFTAGVGENSALVREKVCEGLGYLNLKLDITKNNHHPVDTNIALDSSLPILVIKTQEDWAIAKIAASLKNQVDGIE